jgi:hypothetical protein
MREAPVPVGAALVVRVSTWVRSPGPETEPDVRRVSRWVVSPGPEVAADTTAGALII